MCSSFEVTWPFQGLVLDKNLLLHIIINIGIWIIYIAITLVTIHLVLSSACGACGVF
jgi:hypothetical protein